MPPCMVSAPRPPSSMSLPRAASKLPPALPVITLASALPVPLMLPPPVRVRFSTLAASVVADRALHQVGAAAGRSSTTSPALSTT